MTTFKSKMSKSAGDNVSDNEEDINAYETSSDEWSEDAETKKKTAGDGHQAAFTRGRKGKTKAPIHSSGSELVENSESMPKSKSNAKRFKLGKSNSTPAKKTVVDGVTNFVEKKTGGDGHHTAFSRGRKAKAKAPIDSSRSNEVENSESKPKSKSNAKHVKLGESNSTPTKKTAIVRTDFVKKKTGGDGHHTAFARGRKAKTKAPIDSSGSNEVENSESKPKSKSTAKQVKLGESNPTPAKKTAIVGTDFVKKKTGGEGHHTTFARGRKAKTKAPIDSSGSNEVENSESKPKSKTNAQHVKLGELHPTPAKKTAIVGTDFVKKEVKEVSTQNYPSGRCDVVP